MKIFFKKYLLDIYLINISQMSNMLFMSVCVPLIIGFSEYGKYASLYSVPGFLQGTIEAYLMLILFKNTITKKLVKRILFFIFVGTLITGFTNYYFFGIVKSIISIGLFLALIIRAISTILVYNDLTSKVIVIAFSELLLLLVYIIIIILLNKFGIKTYLVPSLMVIFGSVIYSFFLIINLKKIEFNQIDNNNVGKRNFKLIYLFARNYEELFITLAPLLLLKTFGYKMAGEYRFMLSILKGISKLFPYKYELILRQIKEKSFEKSKFIVISIYFSIIGIIVFFIIKFLGIYYYPDINSEQLYILLISGPIVTIITVYPLMTMHINRLSIITIYLFASIFAISYFIGLALFPYIYIIVTITIYLIVMTNLKKIDHIIE